MPSVEILGGNVEYEILGDSGDLIVLTPGGRFSKDFRGVRPLAEGLVAGGYRVLLWDRPNCGVSDVQFFGPTESHMRAAVLGELLRTLDTGPVILAGGSGGARDSIVTTVEHPDLVRKLVLWNIVGGVQGQFVLGSYYVVPTLLAVRSSGMEAVAALPEWQTLIEANPKNRERILNQDRAEFNRLMLRWLEAYVPKPGQTIPGVPDDRFADIRVPTLIIRGGKDDYDHPKRTSLEVHCLIDGSEVIDPPWPEDAWERATEARARGEDVGGFDTWVQAAPPILDFLARS
ncbi:alpha/beta fold hydrolase [Nocardia aurantia]|uniref:2-hydroxy-6-oxononadienedioate/2-hydroxy-6-oxononatrienedioate hydrolase n=1 Tax=Nocardia aurantia TaxID=2585199 RepID=A0A7K0DPT8_9NOCA|nr:alpha/beta hydrolase [Nocardia aurantia]MQY27617.1 2-hydroxy-6-oxononadienedioate/2-hydroxy-6-oxononatrienedioate hydrolase [Nocardia aurantia]